MSELRAATVSNLAGTGAATLTGQTAAKAWANLNGSGTIAIRASQNISSFTDSGVGVYLANHTVALIDANYSVQLTVGNSGWAMGANNVLTGHSTLGTRSTTACTINVAYTDTSGIAQAFDTADVNYMAVR